MKKVFVLPPGEDWIIDRFVREWNTDNSDMSVDDPSSADVIWLLSAGSYNQIDYEMLEDKRVMTTIHHVVPDKFTGEQYHDFVVRDNITDAYHVPNVHTKSAIAVHTQKPIHIIPYWANQNIWRTTGRMDDLRKKHGLPKDSYLIGSFVRDTEGRDLKSPKLEKGPDLLVDYIEKMLSTGHILESEVHVVLAGWRRQYVISRLEAAKIPYTYFERPSQEVLNDLYQTLDSYPVTARHEGGPQSLIECGLLGVPCVSRDVGIASQVLPPCAISDDVFLAVHEVPNVEHLKLPNGYKPYRDLIQSL